MKKSLLFVLCALLLPIVANAYNFSIDGIYYNKNSDGTSVTVTYKTTSYNSYSGSVVIPSTVTYNDTEYSVTSIGANAFYDCSSLTSVTIPNSVTRIGSWAFFGCSGLTSVTIPNSVTNIGDFVFSGCSGLTSVTIPNGVTSIGQSAFYGCSGLTSVTIPNSVTSIGQSAFYNCTGLTSFTIPNNVTSIGIYAFYNCLGLASITIPNSVTSIGKETFYNCSGLTSVTIGNSVTSIGDRAFDNCTRLTSINIGNSVTGIASSAFSGCSGLKSVTINSNNLVSKTYTYDSNLGTIFGSQVKEYILGDAVTSIGDYAFCNCSDLTSITIPESVTSIGESAFRDCYGLTLITIPNSVTSIGESAFSFCSSLTLITIPNSVTSIGYQAFYNCSGLTSVTIGNSVTSIGDQAFSYCSSLKEVYCMAKQVPSTAYFYGTNIASATLYVPRSAFDNYKSTSPWSGFGTILSLLVYDFEADGICYYINSDWTSVSLTCNKTSYSGSISIPATVTYNSKEYSVTSIGEGAFSDCSGLTSVIIPNSVTSIGGSAFAGCPLQTIVNYGNKEFGENVFSDRTFLHTQLYVPEGTAWDYIYNTAWGQFHHIKEFASKADDIRNDAVYMIADRSGRNFPVYDKATKSLKNVAYTMNIDDNDTGACWQVKKNGGDTYLYNIGAGMYASYDLDNNLALSIAPTAVNIEVTEDGATINGKPAMLVVNKSVTPEPTFILGDANGNGEVEIGDVTSVLTLMATPEATGYNNKAADANQNGEIEIGDVTTILTIMAGE